MAETLFKCQECYCPIHYAQAPFKIESNCTSNDNNVYSIAAQSIAHPDMLSSPICTKCMQKILAQLDIDIRAKEENIKCYNSALKEITAQTAKPTAETEVTRIQEEEVKLQKELAELEGEEASCDQELTGLVKEAEKLENADIEFWSNVALFEKKLIEKKEADTTINRSIANSHMEFSRLSVINVLSDAFKIDTSGQIGVINGNRLGTKLNKTVCRISRCNGRKLISHWDKYALWCARSMLRYPFL